MCDVSVDDVGHANAIWRKSSLCIWQILGLSSQKVQFKIHNLTRSFSWQFQIDCGCEFYPTSELDIYTVHLILVLSVLFLVAEAYRKALTLPDVHKQHLSVSFGVWGCFFCVCWHLPLPGDVWWVSWGCLVGVWGCLSDTHGNRRHSDVFGGIWALSPCSMEP